MDTFTFKKIVAGNVVVQEENLTFHSLVALKFPLSDMFLSVQASQTPVKITVHYGAATYEISKTGLVEFKAVENYIPDDEFLKEFLRRFKIKCIKSHREFAGVVLTEFVRKVKGYLNECLVADLFDGCQENSLKKVKEYVEGIYGDKVRDKS